MRRHDLDVFSLVTGLVFVAVAAGHVLDEASQLDFDGRWVVPLVMVAIGVASLAGLVRGREPRAAEAAATSSSRDGAAGTGSTDGTSSDSDDPGDDGTDETLVLHRDEPQEP